MNIYQKIESGLKKIKIDITERKILCLVSNNSFQIFDVSKRKYENLNYWIPKYIRSDQGYLKKYDLSFRFL